ncbi:MAG: CHC2 zinc finger domain-containing protein [Pseudomonadota bacterium]
MGKLIKFDHVNTHGDFEALLGHFGLDYDKRGAQLRLCCPFHDDTNPSFSITLEATSEAKANTWHCFGCRESGSIIDFAARMLEADLRAGAELVAEVSGCGLAPSRTAKPKRPQERRSGAKKPTTRKSARTVAKARSADPVASESPSQPNPPLKFTLPVDEAHEAVSERVPAGLALTFGLGVCDPKSRSMMAGRLCVPIHDEDGALIAYAGRYLGADPHERKWLLPKGFEKQRVLFNAHRVRGAGTVVLVEGFFDAIRLHGLGTPAVACMGTAVSTGQATLLARLGVKRVVVLFDGDEEGQSAVPDAVVTLSNVAFVRAGALPVGDDPGSAREDDLRGMLSELFF